MAKANTGGVVGKDRAPRYLTWHSRMLETQSSKMFRSTPACGWNAGGVHSRLSVSRVAPSQMAAATRRKHSELWDVRVAIDRKTGFYETFRRWKTVTTWRS